MLAALPNGQGAGSALSIRVVDSAETAATWEPTAESVTVYRVEVRRGELVDTLTEVIAPLPLTVGNDTVVGLQLRRLRADAGDRLLFAFSLRTKRLWRWPLPRDVNDIFHDVMISPNGGHFAYVAEDRSGTYAVVRHFRTGLVIARGPSGGGCECDSDRNHARWVTANSVEIAVAHHYDPKWNWLLFAGRPSLRRFHTSWLKDAPRWH